VTCLQADLLPAAGRKFDLICANLPYIPSATLQTLDVARREPSLALDGGSDGLNLIRRLLLTAPRALASGGLILLEIEATLGATVSQLAQTAFAHAEVALVQDLAGRDRLIRIQA
jgi:release factor glutamine methyltransferase